MGIDFLEKTAKTYERSCQKGYEDLTRVRLFDPSVEIKNRVFLARFEEWFEITPGSELVLRAEGERIIVYFDERAVGRAEEPPRELLEKLQFAEQRMGVGQIDTVHEFSHSADVAVQ